MTESKSPTQEAHELQMLLQEIAQRENRYESMETLGDGGFGHVVRHFDRRLNRTVARKVLHPENADKLHFLRFLLNEARLLSYLDHPGIVPIYDAWVEDDKAFCYTMKVFEGEDLETILKRNQSLEHKMPVSQALQIFTKLCETMAYAHDKGVLHLDLKPANIMVGTYGEVFLLDWGAARLYNRAPYEEYLSHTSKKGTAKDLQDPLTEGVGTLLYSSLEQLTERRDTLLPSADIFSAGVILFYMLTHTHPYEGANTMEYVRSLVAHPPISLMAYRGDVPFRVAAICAKMLYEAPDQRYQSFHEILQELQNLSEAGQSFQTMVFQAGDIILREGEQGDHALQIVEGKVDISVDVQGTTRHLATRTAGDIIGELAVFSGSPRTATVTATEYTVVKILTRDLVERELEKLNPWISHMIRELSSNFIKLTQTHIQRNDPPKP